MITVRPAIKKDIEIIDGIMRTSFTECYGSFMPKQYVKDILKHDVIGKLARKKWNECYIGEDDGIPAGVMQLSGCYIAELWTHPAHQRKGVASALIRRAEQEVLRKGQAHLTLCVYGRNATALEFYNRKGFITQRVEASDRIPEETVFHKVKWLAFQPAGKKSTTTESA